MLQANLSANPLAARIRSGDTQALAEAFRRHRSRLQTIIRFRIDPRIARRLDQDDILQEAYLSASQRCAYLEDPTEPSVFIWLRMIVIQTLSDTHRRHLRAEMRDARREEQRLAPAPSDDTCLSLAARLAGDLTSPTKAVRRAERRERLQTALHALNPLDCEILALRHFEELTNHEVAGILGIGQKAASIRYVRALRRLKDILADLPEFDPSISAG